MPERKFQEGMLKLNCNPRLKPQNQVKTRLPVNSHY